MDTIRKRWDFLATRSGPRVARGAFVVEARNRGDDGAPRYGLTVTKKTGNAPERNRIKRRLRAALCDHVVVEPKAGFDYVVVARRDILTMPFTDLVKRLGKAVSDVTRTDRRPDARKVRGSKH